MNYIEVKIYTTTAGAEFLSPLLSDCGISGYAVEDAEDFRELMDKKNAYDWDYVDESLMYLSDVETNITFYVETGDEAQQQLAALEIRLGELRRGKANSLFEDIPDLGRLHLEKKAVSDDQWKDNWKAYFKPAHITDRIVVKPSWEEYEKREGELVIEIDPGMAFGTGTHPTTTLCVRLLEKHIEAGVDTVLDIGCGSGILSIAAALLGARSVLGVEIDPQAVEVSKENVSVNRLEDCIQVVEGDLTKGLDTKGDILVANLMADLVVLLSPDAAKHLKGKGIYITSGILIEKQQQVAEAVVDAGFDIIEILEEGEWCAIAAQKKV